MPQDLVQIFRQNERNMGRRRGDYDSPQVQRDEVFWEERPNDVVVRICNKISWEEWPNDVVVGVYNKNHLMNSIFQDGRC